jgi:glycosyltransferase involved in cell wall biosynthesis
VKSSARVTYTAASILKPEWNNRTKFTAVPNGVNTDFFLPRSNENLRNELGFKPEDIVVGFVGALEEWVDLEPVFAAVCELAKQSNTYKLLIVGSGSKFAEVKSLVFKCGCENSVIFTGQLPYERIPWYVACMEICVLPFNRGKVAQKALPLKLFEYMSCEKPVVSSPLPAVKEAVADAVLYAQTSDEFKQAILRLATEPGLRTTMGSEGRQLVKRLYSWASICGKFENIALEVVSQAKGI